MSQLVNISRHRIQIMSQKTIPALHYCDVTLRDGLQSLPKTFNLQTKINILDYIVSNRNPQKIEIGSIVSPKRVPQMECSIKLYKYAIQNYREKDFYMLIPNKKGLDIAVKNDIHNISLVTSTSDIFQFNNVNKTLKETKKEMKQMLSTFCGKNIKLYISCIHKCPIVGRITPYNVIKEIYYYSQFKNITEFCLSDTVGEMDYLSFRNLIDILVHFIDAKKISLHLHKSKTNQYEIEKIIQYAIDKGVLMFDVSSFEDMGGCRVTMGDETNANITYETINSVIS
jgi:isopropylmalate/homocitrate/citramalate synthase